MRISNQKQRAPVTDQKLLFAKGGRTISFALIVRQEEANIRRCLESIKNCADEIVIVDTTLPTDDRDKTIEICREYTDKIYEHPWSDNISESRNLSFSYCTSDLIFQIDADEELDLLGRDHRYFKQIIDKIPLNFSAVGLPLIDLRKSEAEKSGYVVAAELNIARIFKNGAVKYERRIHNHPIVDGIMGVLTKFRLKHYGYDLTEEQRKVKADRTIRLLELSLEEDPRDYESMFYLAEAYLIYEKTEENEKKAIELAEKYIRCYDQIERQQKDSFNKSVFYMLGIQYHKKGDHQNAARIIQIASKHLPKDLDYCMLLIKHGIATNNPSLTGAGARGFVTCYDDFDKDIIERGSRFVFNHSKRSLAFALYHLAMTYFEHAKLTSDRMFEVLSDPDLNQEFVNDLKAGFKKHTDNIKVRYDKAPISNGDNPLLQTPESASEKRIIVAKSIRSGLSAAANSG